jgi:hypothetical protein
MENASASRPLTSELSVCIPRLQTPEVLPGGEWVKAKPWDQTATVTETLRKSYVKSRNTGRTQKISGIDGNVGGLLKD